MKELDIRYLTACRCATYLAVTLSLLLVSCADQTPAPLRAQGNVPWTSYGGAAEVSEGVNYLSDLETSYAFNGWGPLEKDSSNGGSNANDGRLLTINGKRFEKGLGMHPAEVERRWAAAVYDLDGKCDTFSAEVGLDDEIDVQQKYGSVYFQVLADSQKLWQSERLTGEDDAVATGKLDIGGADKLKLIVTNAGDNNYYDHADWAGAKVTCETAGEKDDGGEGALPDALVNRTQLLKDDMTLPHEATPRGVPESLNWRDAPRVGMGDDPGTFRALTAWGQLYEDARGNPATNTRVQIRDLRTYVLSRETGVWERVQAAPKVEGAAFLESYADNSSKPADLRDEPSGGVSVTAGGGYNFHFWTPGGRVPIDPGDVAGVITTVRARLVVDDPAEPDDRHEARYLLSVGADYWRDGEAQWDDWKTNADVGIGRFKTVEKDWRLYTMSVLPTEEGQ